MFVVKCLMVSVIVKILVIWMLIWVGKFSIFLLKVGSYEFMFCFINMYKKIEKINISIKGL